MQSAQGKFKFFDGLYPASAFIFLTSRSRRSKLRNPEPLLTGRRVPTKTESASESLDKITGDCLRLQLFFMPTKNQKIASRKPRTDALRNRERILEVAK